MFGSWSNRPRTLKDASTVFGKFPLDFVVRFCVAGAVFGDLGASLFVAELPQPWNGWRLLHLVWASRWSVALRTFYRQILSLTYRCFFFGNFRPRLARLYLYTMKFYLMIWYILGYLVLCYHITVHLSQTKIPAFSQTSPTSPWRFWSFRLPRSDWKASRNCATCVHLFFSTVRNEHFLQFTKKAWMINLKNQRFPGMRCVWEGKHERLFFRQNNIIH